MALSKGGFRMYTWTITTKTMEHLTPEHRDALRRMVYQLVATYNRCEENEQDFRQVYTLLSAFRDIIMSWPLYEFTAAYDELSEWQQSFMGGF